MDEIRELAQRLAMPEPTLYSWVQHGRLRSRPSGAYAKLVHADEAAIAERRQMRATPMPWRHNPPPTRYAFHPTLHTRSLEKSP